MQAVSANIERFSGEMKAIFLKPAAKAKYLIHVLTSTATFREFYFFPQDRQPSKVHHI